VSTDPLFLTLDEVIEIHEQQIEIYGGSHACEIPLPWNQRSQRHRQPLEASTSIATCSPWRLRICFI